jgi:very-short-patch-repair endonuclease
MAMRLNGSGSGRRNAKRLRKEMTPPEIGLWLALRTNPAGLRFRKQHSAGDYVLDFYCAPAALAIEVDGEAHARGDRPARDAVRDAWLAARGVRVLRYPAVEVLANLEGVVRQIIAVAIERRDGLAR